MRLSRFAPSTTGPAHPGTLLAALLCWLDARASGARVILRLEDLDPERSRPGWVDAMKDDLAWLGLDWDGVALQSGARVRHEAALDQLAESGQLYPCRCSRSEIRSRVLRDPDGGWRYDNRCRSRTLPRDEQGGWRSCGEPLRVALSAGRIDVEDESGLDLSGNPVLESGDPVVRRRDGAAAYHLASVVDDAAAGVTRVVRGRDLAPSTAVQVALQRQLGLPTPTYRHHLLLLEESGEKLAKLHGAVAAGELRKCYAAQELCGVLANAAGLMDRRDAVRASELVEGFEWSRVRARDVVMRWTGDRLEFIREVDSPDADGVR